MSIKVDQMNFAFAFLARLQVALTYLLHQLLRVIISNVACSEDNKEIYARNVNKHEAKPNIINTVSLLNILSFKSGQFDCNCDQSIQAFINNRHFFLPVTEILRHLSSV